MAGGAIYHDYLLSIIIIIIIIITNALLLALSSSWLYEACEAAEATANLAQLFGAFGPDWLLPALPKQERLYYQRPHKARGSLLLFLGRRSGDKICYQCQRPHRTWGFLCCFCGTVCLECYSMGRLRCKELESHEFEGDIQHCHRPSQYGYHSGQKGAHCHPQVSPRRPLSDGAAHSTAEFRLFSSSGPTSAMCKEHLRVACRLLGRRRMPQDGMRTLTGA